MDREIIKVGSLKTDCFNSEFYLMEIGSTEYIEAMKNSYLACEKAEDIELTQVGVLTVCNKDERESLQLFLERKCYHVVIENKISGQEYFFFCPSLIYAKEGVEDCIQLKEMIEDKITDYYNIVHIEEKNPFRAFFELKRLQFLRDNDQYRAFLKCEKCCSSVTLLKSTETINQVFNFAYNVFLIDDYFESLGLTTCNCQSFIHEGVQEIVREILFSISVFHNT